MTHVQRRFLVSALLPVLLPVLVSVLVSGLLVVPSLHAPAGAAVPSKSAWLADTRDAMYGSRAFVDRRVAQGGRLAVNLDIDNTALASYFDPGPYGGAVPVVLRFAKYAKARGVSVVFNTARARRQLPEAVEVLRRAGYPVTSICGRRVADGESTPASKQRCRAQFASRGWRIIANVGNSPTDFVGRNYERSFRLPNYGGRLG